MSAATNSPRATSYGAVAKLLHWLIAAILVLQFTVGFLAGEVPRGEPPGTRMHTHISIGIVVLLLILIRFAWRETHRVAPAPGLPAWQRHSAEALHWILYLLVFVTTLTGWFYASARGWDLEFFRLFPLPSLVAEGSPVGRALGSIHEKIIWVLGAAILLHVGAALAHAVIWKDGVLRRMLPS